MCCIFSQQSGRYPRHDEEWRAGRRPGSAEIVGDNNTLRARDINYQQLWNQAGSSIDLPALAEELGRLRATMRQEASEPEHDEALGAVASAEKAAKQGDGPRALEYLKAAGKWTLGIAERIGTELAVVAMKKMMGEG
jgi:hypothetical protein